MISAKEHFILSYYRAGELSGSLLMGRLAMHTTIDSIRVPLTRHCLEEAEHAWMWTNTIERLGMRPLKVTDTYQSEYGREFGLPRSTLEILCLTQVLEKRVLSHFKRHLKRPGTHPLVRECLRKMIADEEGHLGWVWDVLQSESNAHRDGLVEATMSRVEEIDRRVYGRLIIKSPFDEYFGEQHDERVEKDLALYH